MDDSGEPRLAPRHDFYPPLGEYLAGRHTAGYDAAGRARFRTWLAEQVNRQASDRTSGQKSENMTGSSQP